MRLTNGQFVKYLLESDDIVNDIVHYLLVSEKLIKRHGNLLFVLEILEQIKKESVDLYNFLLLLKLSKKTSIKDIKVITSLLKKQSKIYKSEFIVVADKKVDQDLIEEYLEKKIKNVIVEHKTIEGEELFIAGEGRYYKRNLEQDIKKILDI